MNAETLTSEKTQAKPTVLSPELMARDRIELLTLFMQAQLTFAKENLDEALEEVVSSSRMAAAHHAMCALSIAEEYLDELKKLEDRPIARNA